MFNKGRLKAELRAGATDHPLRSVSDTIRAAETESKSNIFPLQKN